MILGIFAAGGYVWWIFDVWSNLEFIGQKSGLIWQVVYFLFATPMGAKIISAVFFTLFVGSLLFQFERTKPPELPESPVPPLLASTVPQEKTEKPNLVFRQPERVHVHSKYLGVLEEGRNTDQDNFDADTVAVVLPVENEFSHWFKTAPVPHVTAHLSYIFHSGEPLRVNRGAWLNDGNRISFRVNDIHRLIVALIIPGSDPLVVAIRKEYQDTFNHLEHMVQILDEDNATVRIKLISEDGGLIYADSIFTLKIQREPLLVDLIPGPSLKTSET